MAVTVMTRTDGSEIGEAMSTHEWNEMASAGFGDLWELLKSSDNLEHRIREAFSLILEGHEGLGLSDESVFLRRWEREYIRAATFHDPALGMERLRVLEAKFQDYVDSPSTSVPVDFEVWEADARPSVR